VEIAILSRPLSRSTSPFQGEVKSVCGSGAKPFGISSDVVPKATARHISESHIPKLAGCAMTEKMFATIAAVIFALVALLHLLRLVMGWSVVIDSWMVPMWVSWVGLVVAGGLSYYGARLAMRS
jgi:hypothetical protein